jgi:serine/threonine protein kinase
MEWNEKSDVWSIACIFAELYTGELLFPTHDNEEHLALLEKSCGPIPFWMADNCRTEFKKIFQEKPDLEIEKSGHRVNFHKLKKREDVEAAVKSLETLDVKLFIKYS